MKIHIRDRDFLNRLSHIDIKAYLFAQHWSEEGSLSNKATIFSKADSTGRDWEILLPMRQNLADYAERMEEVISALAIVEQRSELAIIRDLQESGVDVIRISSPHEDNGSISITEGVLLHEQAQNMLLSAACSAIAPRAAYHARKMTEAVQYIEDVRLGQTEIGSYVITIQSPVTPTLRRGHQASLFQDEPFPRKVTIKLAEAWKALRDAVVDVAKTDDFAAFESRIPMGVNANLCEAVALLAHHCKGVHFGLSWARVRKAPAENVTQFFTQDEARFIEEAAREFQRNQPRLDTSIQCFVTNLDRPLEAFNGKATLLVTIDGKSKKIKAEFDQNAYELVIRAFQDKVVIALDGDIYANGSRFELKNPRNIQIVEEGDDGE
jgi:hypothetical protein